MNEGMHKQCKWSTTIYKTSAKVEEEEKSESMLQGGGGETGETSGCGWARLTEMGNPVATEIQSKPGER